MCSNPTASSNPRQRRLAPRRRPLLSLAYDDSLRIKRRARQPFCATEDQFRHAGAYSIRLGNHRLIYGRTAYKPITMAGETQCVRTGGKPAEPCAAGSTRESWPFMASTHRLLRRRGIVPLVWPACSHRPPQSRCHPGPGCIARPRASARIYGPVSDRSAPNSAQMLLPAAPARHSSQSVWR